MANSVSKLFDLYESQHSTISQHDGWDWKKKKVGDSLFFNKRQKHARARPPKHVTEHLTISFSSAFEGHQVSLSELLSARSFQKMKWIRERQIERNEKNWKTESVVERKQQSPELRSDQSPCRSTWASSEVVVVFLDLWIELKLVLIMAVRRWEHICVIVCSWFWGIVPVSQYLNRLKIDGREEKLFMQLSSASSFLSPTSVSLSFYPQLTSCVKKPMKPKANKRKWQCRWGSTTPQWSHPAISQSLLEQDEN